MWITLQDREREYVINFDNIICFSKSFDCHRTPTIMFITLDGDITLTYATEEERDKDYSDTEYLLKQQGK